MKSVQKLGKIHKLFLLVISTTLIACGGGGSETRLGEGSGADSGSSSSTGSGVSLFGVNNESWQEGLFNPSGEFKNLCYKPRIETDQITQAPIFPDTMGSLLDEKNWLRSWSNENYFWYSEIVDSNPSLVENPVDYFSKLKTLETSVSGKQKDRFHFTQSTKAFKDESQSGITIGYGFTVIISSNQIPREIIVAYTQFESPSSSDSINIKRGSKILAVDGIDLINTADDDPSLKDAYSGLFPALSDETHSFTIQDSDGFTREVEMNSVQLILQPVQISKVIDTNEGKLGYLLFNEHIEIAEKQLIDAMIQFQNENISDLVLDIRYNGGGLVYIANSLASMISSAEKTEGTIFSKETFNDKHPSIDPFTGNEITGNHFYQTSSNDQQLPHLNLSRVFVLTGEGTCSASELIINSLRGIGVEVIQIGSTTCGKPYGFYPTDNCGTTYFSLNFKSENAMGFGDYDDGFSPEINTSATGVLLPGCSVADDFSKELGDIEEARLATAIFYRDNGECPPSLSKSLKKQDRNEIPSKSFWLNNAVK